MSSAEKLALPVTILKRILVATDFSPSGRKAVWRAGQLAQAHDAAIHLVHARPDWNLFCRSSTGAAEHYRQISEQAEEALRLELAYLESTFGLRARGETRMGRASEVLASVISEWNPHLLVLGARGEHGTPDAPLVGGTALKVIVEANCPVLLVRESETGPYTVALAAIDDTREMAERVVAWATSLVATGDCHVVHAFDVPYVKRMYAHGISQAAIDACTEEARNSASALLDRIIEKGAREGRTMHAHLRSGGPIEAVLSEVERQHPQLVVVGKHQSTPRESATRFVGTNALRIAYHCPSDVLIVP